MKSIMHNKNDRTCYLCMMLNCDYQTRTGLEEHHIFMGNKERKISERYGLKVYLCREHHENGKMAVHKNYDLARMLQKLGQQEFEKTRSREEWMKLFGRNYIT